jgi:hypothetical protein
MISFHFFRHIPFNPRILYSFLLKNIPMFFILTVLNRSFDTVPLQFKPNLSLVAACDRLVLNIIWKPVQILRQSKAKVCTLLEGLVGSFFIFNGRHEPQHHSLPSILLTSHSWNFYYVIPASFYIN